MDAVLVDSDVFSYMFKGDSRGERYKRAVRDATYCLSFMSIAELHRWTLVRRWGPKRRDMIGEAMRRCVTMPYHADMAIAWARIDVERGRAGRPIACGDGWIAATAIVHRLPLATNNMGDFSGTTGLRIIPLD